MAEDEPETRTEAIEPLDPQICSIQPGGGLCMRIELAWGKLRRAYLKAFRKSYLRHMAERRLGEQNTCPHEVLDPRDVKYFRNQGGYYWPPEEDPFRWRDRLPFARAGLAELLILGGGAAVLTIAALATFPYLALLPALGFGAIVWFFRDPPRRVPAETGAIVAPADGKVVSIREAEHEELIGIFLSIFNVHINRAPASATVLRLQYRHGKYLNALYEESARENQQMAISLQEATPPHRKLAVRQISGAIARRIVCSVRPGERLERGERFGMIKLGSRTELVLAVDESLHVEARVGDRVRAGATILARYEGDQPAEVS